MNRPRQAQGPLYVQIKDHVLDRIRDGQWKPGDRTPSENELVRQFGVARMTVNRALRELSDEGFLKRIPGVGTFVAEARSQGHLLEVLNIADEIRGRGHEHSSQVLRLQIEPAPSEIALGLHLAPKTPVFHSRIVHFENGQPLQFEDRYVHPEAAPAYGDQDFSTLTPSQYLLRVAPLLRVEHVVQAVIPEESVQQALEMESGEPCLLLRRRTWSGEVVASMARLYYSGASYQLGDRFEAPQD